MDYYIVFTTEHSFPRFILNQHRKMSFHVRIADYFFVATVSVDSRKWNEE